jgi:hypothetical protein
MTEAFVKRPLNTVLKNGEVIGHFTKGAEFYAEYKDGHLYPFTEKVRKDGKVVKEYDKETIFDTATSFCNFHVKSKVNGWREARVLREGQWIRLGELVPSEEHKVTETDLSKEEMPPKKVANHILKTKKAEAVVPPIIATTIESNEDPIEVANMEEVSIMTIKVNETLYYLDSQKRKIYEKLKDGSVGKYVGRYNSKIAGKIDTSKADSDDEYS